VTCALCPNVIYARGLCRTCYRRKWGRGTLPDERPSADGSAFLPARRPGEPFYRCAHCGRYLCAAPLRLCVDCSVELELASVGMPRT
jgi:hypothetical protein